MSSDLELLKTIELPPGPRGVEGQDSGEARILADNATILVSTFQCGLYMLKDLTSNSPHAELVYDFGARHCAVPVQIGNYWIEPVPFNSIVTLDVADPAKPKEVARLALGGSNSPHWMSIEPFGRRIVITGYFGLSGRVLLGAVDQKGNIRLDDRFGTDASGEGGLRMEDAEPHGAVFSWPNSRP
jgi:hypothetical protein